jgi:hypothetical protein
LYCLQNKDKEKKKGPYMFTTDPIFFFFQLVESLDAGPMDTGAIIGLNYYEWLIKIWIVEKNRNANKCSIFFSKPKSPWEKYKWSLVEKIPITMLPKLYIILKQALNAHVSVGIKFSFNQKYPFTNNRDFFPDSAQKVYFSLIPPRRNNCFLSILQYNLHIFLLDK